MKIRLIAFTMLLHAGLMSAAVTAQKQKPIPACSQATFAALRELPKMEYDCPDETQEWDGKILKLPERLEAIRQVVKQLGGFRNPNWWRAGVDELNACS